jgi:hypothetical protein
LTIAAIADQLHLNRTTVRNFCGGQVRCGSTAGHRSGATRTGPVHSVPGPPLAGRLPGRRVVGRQNLSRAQAARS